MLGPILEFFAVIVGKVGFALADDRGLAAVDQSLRHGFIDIFGLRQADQYRRRYKTDRRSGGFFRMRL